MRRAGARPDRMAARIMGGASMFGNLLSTSGIRIGERNVSAVRLALAAAGVPIIAEDVGADYGRSGYFDVESGQIEVRSIRNGSRVL
jgi:chemotaxis protein CheD